jgi:hypothetical protein
VANRDRRCRQWRRRLRRRPAGRRRVRWSSARCATAGACTPAAAPCWRTARSPPTSTLSPLESRNTNRSRSTTRRRAPAAITCARRSRSSPAVTVSSSPPSCSTVHPPQRRSMISIVDMARQVCTAALFSRRPRPSSRPGSGIRVAACADCQPPAASRSRAQPRSPRSSAMVQAPPGRPSRLHLYEDLAARDPDPAPVRSGSGAAAARDPSPTDEAGSAPASDPLMGSRAANRLVVGGGERRAPARVSHGLRMLGRDMPTEVLHTEFTAAVRAGRCRHPPRRTLGGLPSPDRRGRDLGRRASASRGGLPAAPPRLSLGAIPSRAQDAGDRIPQLPAVRGAQFHRPLGAVDRHGHVVLGAADVAHQNSLLLSRSE